MQADVHDLAGLGRLSIKYIELVAQEPLKLWARLSLAWEDRDVTHLYRVRHRHERPVPE